MKIAILTQYYKPEMGAPQNRLYEMAIGLKNNGCKVSVITAMPNYPTGKILPKYKGKFSCHEFLDTLEIIRYWLYASNSKKSFPRILSMLSFSFTSLFSLGFLRKNKFDYIIVESPPLTLGFTGYILAKLTGAQLILNVSDLWPLSAKELGAISNGFIYRQLENLERFLYKKSVLCLGQSKEICDYIEEYEADRVYLFRNGVDPSRFKEVNNIEKSEQFKIVYAGLLGVAQGIFDICKNVKFRENNAEFHIYGAGGDEQKIIDFLKENPNQGIYFHGSIPREEIPHVLASADCTLIPLIKNIYGAVPSKIYESMAAGLPIMFSGEGEGARIVQEHKLGWVSEPKNYQALENIIKQIQSNPDQILDIKKNCINAATNLFNRPKQIQRLYKELLDLKN